MKKFLLDENVIWALFNPSHPLYADAVHLIAYLAKNKHSMVMGGDLNTKYFCIISHLLGKHKNSTAQHTMRTLKEILINSFQTEPSEGDEGHEVHIPRKDIFLYRLAMGGKADYLVTEDEGFLEGLLKIYDKTKISPVRIKEALGKVI